MSETIFTNDVLEVGLETGQLPGDPQLISIRLPEQPVDMPGEVLVAPGDVPDLVKALVDAALAAYLRK